MLSSEILNKSAKLISQFLALQARGFADNQEQTDALKKELETLIQEIKASAQADEKENIAISLLFERLITLQGLITKFPIATTLDKLPLPILLNILENLDIRSVVRVSQVNKLCKKTFENDAVLNLLINKVPEPEKTWLLAKTARGLTPKKAWLSKLPANKKYEKKLKGLRELERLLNQQPVEAAIKYFEDLSDALIKDIQGIESIGNTFEGGRTRFGVLSLFNGSLGQFRAKLRKESEKHQTVYWFYQFDSFAELIQVLLYASRHTKGTEGPLPIILNFLKQCKKTSLTHNVTTKFFKEKLTLEQLFNSFLSEEYLGFFSYCLKNNINFNLTSYPHPIFYVIDKKSDDAENASQLCRFFIENDPDCFTTDIEIKPENAEKKTFSFLEFAFSKAQSQKSNLNHFNLAQKLLTSIHGTHKLKNQSLVCLSVLIELEKSHDKLKTLINCFDLNHFEPAILLPTLLENQIALDLFITEHANLFKKTKNGESFWHKMDIIQLLTEEKFSTATEKLLTVSHTLLLSTNFKGETAIEIFLEKENVKMLELIIKSGHSKYITSDQIKKSKLAETEKENLIELLESPDNANHSHFAP